MSSRSLPQRGDRALFDVRPIELDGFTLTGRSARAVGRPSPKQWVAAMQFAAGTEQSSPFWIGDLMRYAEDRADWQEKLSQMIALTGLSEKTVRNHTAIARSVEEPERQLAPSFSHVRAVAALERPQQTKVLERARAERWTVAQTETAVRKIRRPLILEGQAALEGQYRVILAAPDWRRMPVHAIAGLPVQAHAAKDAVLFLYAPARLMVGEPGVREVLTGWGFTYRTNGVWDRVQDAGDGTFLNLTHEHLVIAERGECRPDAIDYRPRSVHVERRSLSDTHQKPETIRRQWIERLYTRGPYLELFGVAPVAGWSVFGSDPGEWARQAEEEASVDEGRLSHAGG